MQKLLFPLLISWLAATGGLTAQRFKEVNAEAGIENHAVDPDIIAGGVAWLDYNSDRYPDLLMTNGLRAVRLYRNNWDGTFTDVTETASLLGQSDVMGVVCADFDGDGLTDLFFTTSRGQTCRLLRNTGEGEFRDVTVEAGVTHTSYGASATVGDIDGDGDPDVYVTNYLAGPEAQDGGQPNFLYRNDGDFRFTEIAAAVGLDDAGCGLGATFADLDNDGRQDIYVANDYGYLIEPNEYFRNLFPRFERRAESSGSAATINGMGVARGDYDNDGDVDIYVTNIRENPLFENTEGGAFFRFQSIQAGVALPELTSWGATFADFNLDGYEDLVVTNGEVAEVDNAAQPMSYFRNNGDGSFTDASATGGMTDLITMGRGLAVADYNLDGRPDVAVNAVRKAENGTDPALLIRNDGTTAGHWLAVETPPGATRLSLHAGGNTWLREVDGGSSYLSHAAVPVHFGAPAGTTNIDSITVSYAHQPDVVHRGMPWDALIGLRGAGEWYRIAHAATSTCAATPGAPVVTTEWSGDNATLLIRRSATEAFPRLDPVTVEVEEGEVFRGLARTRDAVLVDTIAGNGSCPTLQPVELRVRDRAAGRAIYPNPLTGDVLTVRPDQPGGEATIELFDQAGALIFRTGQSVTGRTFNLSLNDLPTGGYVCRLTHRGTVSHHKLIRR